MVQLVAQGVGVPGEIVEGAAQVRRASRPPAVSAAALSCAASSATRYEPPRHEADLVVAGVVEWRVMAQAQDGCEGGV